MLEIISAKSRLAKKYKLKKGVKILGFDNFEAQDTLDYIYYDSKPSFSMRIMETNGCKREIKVEKAENESLNLIFKDGEKIRTLYVLAIR